MPSSNPASTKSPPASATAAGCTEAIRGGLVSRCDLLAEPGEVVVAHRRGILALHKKFGRGEPGRSATQHLSQPFLLTHALRGRLLGEPCDHVGFQVLHVHVHRTTVPKRYQKRNQFGTTLRFVRCR